MGKENLDNILEECLERLAKGETIEQCLASYPGQAAELEPLLRTAALVKKASAITPRPEFRERARYQFQAAVCEAAQPKPRRAFGWLGWQPRWATVAIAVLIFVLAGSGTMAAASSSMPDEPLYPVKLATETMQLTLTRSDLGKAQLYVRLADKRVAEIVKMAEKGKAGQVEKATERLDTYLQKVVVLTALTGKATALQAPAPLAAPAPTPVPAATPVPTVTPAPAPAPRPSPPPPTITVTVPPRAGATEAPVAPGQDKKEDTSKSEPAKTGAVKAEAAKAATAKALTNRAKVKAEIAELANKHTEELKAVLKNAPESVKPALRRAIAVSVADYQQALEALDSEEDP